MENYYCPGCAGTYNEQCEILCPKVITCGAGNEVDPECINIVCFPTHLLMFIISIPCCICNVAMKYRDEHKTIIITDQPSKLECSYETKSPQNEENN
jgi:hypothetical protein